MLWQTPRNERRQLITTIKSELSLRKRCELLGVNRSSLYYETTSADIDDVSLLNEIRDVWDRYPFYGYRRITKELRHSGFMINGKRVRRLMMLAGIRPIYPGPNSSKRNQAHAVYPYLLRGLQIIRPNQVWQTDITYLRLDQGFVYLVALIDVYSRYVVGWRISNTLETTFCLEALESGLLVGTPEIINSDQGCQFTSDDWVRTLQKRDINISMTGKGRCLDNIYIERFWRSVKREEFYLNDYANVRELKQAIKAYIEFYNHKRWHQSLDYKTPAEVYFTKAAGRPVDIWTNSSNRPTPTGTCGQGIDNAYALPTT